MHRLLQQGKPGLQKARVTSGTYSKQHPGAVAVPIPAEFCQLLCINVNSRSGHSTSYLRPSSLLQGECKGLILDPISPVMFNAAVNGIYENSSLPRGKQK